MQQILTGFDYQHINAAINKVVGDPQFRDKLAALGAEPVGGDPGRFASLIRSETAKWAKVIAEAGVKAE